MVVLFLSASRFVVAVVAFAEFVAVAPESVAGDIAAAFAAVVAVEFAAAGFGAAVVANVAAVATEDDAAAATAAAVVVVGVGAGGVDVGAFVAAVASGVAAAVVEI